ncbi:unnamed protein product [Cylindrotheca closterium]|uniref:Uncharacterized protein n=1 Tax=Cylindrotheca closterium TaxID=2856 RepID=A0AAD2G8M8_9STRA|nr:unnamed protein product [Cylindrotheca closterium]
MPPSTTCPQRPSLVRTKKITFSENISTSVPLSELHKNNTSDTWYTRQEMKDIRRHASLVVQAMRHSSKNCGETELGCTYGLSHHVRNDIVKRRKAGALSAVLDEQSMQRQESKTIDHDLIADVYFEETKRNQSDASQRGKDLEEEVISIWSEPAIRHQIGRSHRGPLVKSAVQTRMVTTRRAC